MKKWLLLLLFPLMLSAQDKIPDFNITGAGARAEGFGGAFIGLADDATAVVWNPAGLTQLERPEASIVTRFVGESNSYKNDLDATFNADESQSSFALNFSSVAVPLMQGPISIVAALAYQQQLDFSETRRRKYEYIDATFTQNDIEQRLETTGGVNTFTPAIAVKFLPYLSAGLSANIWTGSIERDENIRLSNGPAFIRLRSQTAADYTGFNLSLGGMIDLEGLPQNGFPLKIGAILRTPFTIEADGSDDSEGETNIVPTRKDRATISQTIEMPLMIGFGTSYRMGDNLTVAADFEMRNFKGNTVTNSSSSRVNGDTTVTTPISESDDNLNQFRIGAEYLIVMDNGVIPLRAGFKTVPTVLANYVYDESSDEDLPTNNQVRGTGISFGSGYISDVFALDVTMSITNYRQNYHPYGGIDYSIVTLGSSVIVYF
jgi:long-subunit fatty acid transport protein